MALVVPVTFARGHSGSAERGFEDSLISARYRFNAAPVAEALRLDGASVMAVGGLEIPTGTLEHSFGRGPVGQIAAGLISLERRPFSLSIATCGRAATLGGAWTQSTTKKTGSVPTPDSGGSGVFVHPGLVAMVVPRVQFFVLTSLPLTQEWNTVEDKQRFRVGAGAILVLGH